MKTIIRDQFLIFLFLSLYLIVLSRALWIGNFQSFPFKTQRQTFSGRQFEPLNCHCSTLSLYPAGWLAPCDQIPMTVTSRTTTTTTNQNTIYPNCRCEWNRFLSHPLPLNNCSGSLPDGFATGMTVPVQVIFGHMCSVALDYSMSFAKDTSTLSRLKRFRKELY